MHEPGFKLGICDNLTLESAGGELLCSSNDDKGSNVYFTPVEVTMLLNDISPKAAPHPQINSVEHSKKRNRGG